jgi:hypothetical protein
MKLIEAVRFRLFYQFSKAAGGKGLPISCDSFDLGRQ